MIVFYDGICNLQLLIEVNEYKNNYMADDGIDIVYLQAGIFVVEIVGVPHVFMYPIYGCIKIAQTKENILN